MMGEKPVANIKSDPSVDSATAVFWLKGLVDPTTTSRVIVTVDADQEALRITTPAGEEVVIYAASADVPSETQLFLPDERGNLDELREEWAARVTLGQLYLHRDAQFGPSKGDPIKLPPEATPGTAAHPKVDWGVADLELLAKEMFPTEYAAIDDSHPMDPALVQQVKDELERRIHNLQVGRKVTVHGER